MADVLILVTQISSIIAFILILIAVILGLRAFFKFTGEGPFRRGILLLGIFLILFLLSVGFMFLYHLEGSELMGILWYTGLFIALIVGILSSIYSYSFLKSIRKNIKKKKLKKR